MKTVSFDEFFGHVDGIIDRLKNEKFDLIVAIANGGIIPASFLQERLRIPMNIIRIKYRDEDNNPMFEEPKLMHKGDLDIKGKRILLVDDVLRTGKTLSEGKKHLKGNEIKTFVINGKADYNLYYQKECIKMPWKR
jgi:hypoxanthine phosphoribosyltransferase